MAYAETSKGLHCDSQVEGDKIMPTPLRMKTKRGDEVKVLSSVAPGLTLLRAIDSTNEQYVSLVLEPSEALKIADALKEQENAK